MLNCQVGTGLAAAPDVTVQVQVAMKPAIPVSPFSTINVTATGDGLPGLRHRPGAGGLLMAPPIPGRGVWGRPPGPARRPPPVRIRRRTPGDLLAGIAAVVLLVALTVGVPIALITVVGLPLPHTMPNAVRAHQPA